MNRQLLLIGLVTLLGLLGCAPAPTPAPVDPLPLPADTYLLAETLARAGRPSLTHAVVDRTTFYYPVLAGTRSRRGYPIYVIQCNDFTDTCQDDLGHALGSMQVVAMHLTPVRNADVDQLRCRVICTNSNGEIVGAPSKAILDYRAATLPPRSTP